MSPAAIKQRAAEHRAWVIECETPSSWEVIALWLCVAIAIVCTLIVAAGGAGYILANHSEAITAFFTGE